MYEPPKTLAKRVIHQNIRSQEVPGTMISNFVVSVRSIEWLIILTKRVCSAPSVCHCIPVIYRSLMTAMAIIGP